MQCPILTSEYGMWQVASETLSNIVIIGSVHVSRQRSNNLVPCIGYHKLYYFLGPGAQGIIPDKTDLIRNNGLMVERQ